MKYKYSYKAFLTFMLCISNLMVYIRGKAIFKKMTNEGMKKLNISKQGEFPDMPGIKMTPEDYKKLNWSNNKGLKYKTVDD